MEIDFTHPPDVDRRPLSDRLFYAGIWAGLAIAATLVLISLGYVGLW